MKIEIYLLDRDTKTAGRIGWSDYDDGVLEILQYLMDTMHNLDNVGLYSPEKDRWFSTAKVVSMTGLRRRTFDEKMAKVKTWTIPAPRGTMQRG